MPEFKAYEGKNEKLGGFYKMWNMLKKEAEKKPQDLSITIIDTEYNMTGDSLKRAATKKYVDDQLRNTFADKRTERAGMVATNPCYQYIATPHISSPSFIKKMRN
jgi:hypothetical protein